MANPMKIESLTQPSGNDLKALIRVLQDAVEDGASVGFLAPVSETDAEAFWRQTLDDLGPNYRMWVARDANGQIVGTVQLACATKQTGMHRGEVRKFLVHREAQGQGAARGLMEAVEDFCRANRRTLLYLDTMTGSHAEAVYRHFGWTRVGDIPGYVAGPDGLIQSTTYYYKAIAP